VSLKHLDKARTSCPKNPRHSRGWTKYTLYVGRRVVQAHIQLFLFFPLIDVPAISTLVVIAIALLVVGVVVVVVVVLISAVATVLVAILTSVRRLSRRAGGVRRGDSGSS